MATKQPGVWGIDLGQCALKAVRLEMIDGKVTATAFDYIEHPKILSQPDADADQLAREALQQFLSRNTLKGDLVAISVPGQSGLARFVKLPPVEEKKINDIVRFEAKQQIPFPLEEVVWDYQKIGSGTVSDGFALETEIGLFAMKRDTINFALQNFTSMNIEVHIVQMAPLALCNFIAYDQLKKGGPDSDETVNTAKKCVVALDIGADNSNLVITDAERIIWQRPIPIGGNHFTRALTKDLKLTFAKAEHVKRNAIKSPDLKKILTALRPVLNDFVAEVQRSLGYFTNTHRDATILHLIGLGNAFRLPGLQKFLQERLQLEVIKLQKLERVSGESVTSAPQFTENVLSFAVAYGLALQGLGLTKLQTNLLPREIQTERIIRAKKPWVAAAVAALLVALAGLTIGQKIRYDAYASEGVEQGKSLVTSALKQKDAIENNFNAKLAEIKASEIAVNRIASGAAERLNWNLMYKYLYDVLPQPNGTKLSQKTSQNEPALDQYFRSNQKAQEAFKHWYSQQTTNPSEAKSEKAAAELQEFIKKHLVQINIEGIGCLYSDDLSTMFKNLVAEKHKLRGMTPEEIKAVYEEPDKLPKSGWVFEIRGYTHHNNGEVFVLDSLVENIRYPEKMVIDPNTNATYQLLPQMSEWLYKSEPGPDGKPVRGLSRISHVLLYKTFKDDYPQTGVLRLVSSSALRQLLESGTTSGPGGDRSYAGTMGYMPGGRTPSGSGGDTPQDGAGAAKRSGWTPVGEIAMATFGSSAAGGQFGGKAGGLPGAGTGRDFSPGGIPGGGQQNPTTAPPEGVQLQPRTEFIILFIWDEPTTLEDAPTTE